jgi:sulfur-oxidizing protein SoxA
VATAVAVALSIGCHGGFGPGLQTATHSAAAAVPASTPTSAPPTAPRRSGFDYMTPATQALQRDDSANPGMLWVQGGQQRFEADCRHCHSAASLRGAAPRYPGFDAVLGKPVTLAGRINQCQQRHLKREPWVWESEPLLELEAYVAHQSRGLPLAAVEDPRLQAATAQGRQLWQQPLGQLQLSCAQCHDQQAGRRLAGSTIPEAHATGYPLYRLEWQTLGSLQRRLRGCMGGVRAEPFAYGADEWVAVELWLRQRAAGMVLETPAVRP